MTPDTLDMLKSISPWVVNVYINNGEMNMSKESRVFKNNNFSGAKFGDNVNFLSHNIEQHKNAFSNEIVQVLNEIKETISDPEVQEEAIESLEKIDQAIQEGKKDRAKRYFKMLPEVIQLSAAGITLLEKISSII